jgi:DNA replication and repair protein RecF
MRLRKLTVRHFRNVGFAALEFSGRQQFLLGGNGQGKTNLLEAAGYLTALRSFRTTENKLLVGHGQHTAAIAFAVEHERMQETQVTIKVRHDGKELWCDGARVTRLADHLGKFPTVVFSSQDLQLVRGAPAVRRRWLDLTLAAMDAGYLRALQTFTRALAERNALLKSGPDFTKASSGRRALEDQLAAFEQTLAPAAAELIALRATGLRALGATLKTAYGRLCAEAEPAGLGYEPNFAEPSAEALLARLESGRARDFQLRSTLVGPHRDDIHFSVRHVAAKDFGSEGQQRSFVLALRLAQAAWFHEKSGVRPVLLADDVLGELDPARRRRFWATIDPESQVIATGTHVPDAELGTWQIFEVVEGAFTERITPVEAAS